jgi:hypothetical protein
VTSPLRYETLSPGDRAAYDLFGVLPGLASGTDPEQSNHVHEVEELSTAVVEAAISNLFPENSKWMGKPLAYLKDELNEFLWSMQRRIVESVWDHQYTAVPSCHGSGKSFIASRIAVAWIMCHPLGSARVVTSAPTAAQVSKILWHEIGRAHRQGNLPGTIGIGAVPNWRIGREEVAFGRKPADKADRDDAMQAFQGIHAEYVLVILDEATGIPKWLWDAARSLATSEDSRILAIGNPDNPASEFANVCKPGSGWNVLPISAFDLPWNTEEYVPKKLQRHLTNEQWVLNSQRAWGATSPIYKSKVLGQFPKVSTDTLISPDLIEKAIYRDLSEKAAAEDRPRYGMDIADQGADRTAIYVNTAGVIRRAVTPEGEICRWQGQTPEKTAAQAFRILREGGYVGSAVCDSIGLGMVTISHMQKAGLPVAGFNAAKKAHSPKFYNARSEQWWRVREMFVRGEIDLDPDDHDLHAQLGSIKWTVEGDKIRIEPKDDTKARLGTEYGLDDADAFMHSTVDYDHLPPAHQRGNERTLPTTHPTNEVEPERAERKARRRSTQLGEVEPGITDGLLDKDI